MRSMLAVTAIAVTALVAGMAPEAASATILTIDTSAFGLRDCRIATGICGSIEGLSIVGGIQQGLIFSAAYEYALPSLPSNAVVDGAFLSIGAYSRYGETGFQGFQDRAIGTINLTSYVGNGVFEGADADHREAVDFTLLQARTRQYDITGLVQSYLTAGRPYLGFSIYQSPPGVCGFGNRCEVSMTGDSVEFAFAVKPQLVISYFEAVPPPLGLPEPSSWAMMITGFGLVGAAMRRRGAMAAA